jgi:hypothetical protein
MTRQPGSYPADRDLTPTSTLRSVCAPRPAATGVTHPSSSDARSTAASSANLRAPVDELRRFHAQARPSPRPQADHGTLSRHAMGCDCDAYPRAQRNYQREKVRAEAQARFPQALGVQLLDALATGTPFEQAIADLGLSSRRVWD